MICISFYIKAGTLYAENTNGSTIKLWVFQSIFLKKGIQEIWKSKYEKQRRPPATKIQTQIQIQIQIQI